MICNNCNKPIDINDYYSYKIINDKHYCNKCAELFKSKSIINFAKILIVVIAVLGLILGIAFGFLFKSITSDFNIVAMIVMWIATAVTVVPLVYIYLHLQNQDMIIQQNKNMIEQNDLIIKILSK